MSFFVKQTLYGEIGKGSIFKNEEQLGQHVPNYWEWDHTYTDFF